MAEYRTFKTGATRTPDDSKIDFEGFLCPLVMARFGRYMHKHRKRLDGSLRESDNWQKGIPIPAYMKSTFRHFHAAWKRYRITGKISENQLCALLFNVQGMLHESIKQRRQASGRARRPASTSKTRRRARSKQA